MRLPCIITTSLPPPTVFGFAWPPPANLVLQVRSSQPSGDDVKGKNFRQGVLILRLQQVLDSRNASLLGAKTVNAPGPFNQCTKPAAPFIAFTSVLCSAALTSLSIIIGRIHFLPSNYGIVGIGIAEPAARARMSSNKTAIFFFMISPWI
jgi:hypothetical protein